jgi:hypothetical protein
MKKITLGILGSALLASPCYSETSTPAAFLTAQVKEGKCSLDKDNWCPTYAEDIEGGFRLNATAKTLRYMALNYENLKVPCFLWKTAGGNADAIASLLITDKEGRKLLMSRRCE